MVKYGISHDELSEIFTKHLKTVGFALGSHTVQLTRSGKRQYFQTDNSKKKTAWYVVDLNEAKLRYGWFHAGGMADSYSLFEYIRDNNLKPGDLVYTKEQREKDKLKTELAKKRQLENEKLAHSMAVIYCSFEWSRGLPIPEKYKHNYAVKKKIPMDRLKIYNPKNFTKTELKEYIDQNYAEFSTHSILINRILDLQPSLASEDLRQGKLMSMGQNIKNQIVFIQTIAAQKNKKGEDKWSLRNVIQNGAFRIIFKDKDLLNWDGKRIIFCEGLATGECIAMAINYSIPVIVTYFANNIANVAIEFRKLHPEAIFYFFADNDAKTALKSKINRNPGIYSATKAAEIVCGYIIAPNFKETEIDCSDWADYYAIYGLQETTEAIRYAMLKTAITSAKGSTIAPTYPINTLFYSLDINEILEEPSDIDTKIWFSLIYGSYSKTIQRGYTQIHEINTVREKYISTLHLEAQKEIYQVEPKRDFLPETWTQTNLIEQILRNKHDISIISIETKKAIDKQTIALGNIQKARVCVKKILSVFFEKNVIQSILDKI